MTQLFDLVPQRRAIIERRALSDALMALEGNDSTKLRAASVAISSSAALRWAVE